VYLRVPWAFLEPEEGRFNWALLDTPAQRWIGKGKRVALRITCSKGVTLRDDSILVQPPPRSWYHAEMAQEFWPRWPVILEHEHYGGSKQRGAWGDGSLLLKAVEDYHANPRRIPGPPV
jgi:hypothetical protein